MPDASRNRSMPATHSGPRGRDANRHHRRDTDHAPTTSSAARSHGGSRQLVSSTVSPSGTDGDTLNTDNSQAHPLPSWIVKDGFWYHLTPDGDYRMWHNVGSLVGDTGDQETPVDKGEGPTGQDMNNNWTYESWDAFSRRPNQGSAYFDSTQNGTDADTDDQYNERYLPEREDLFLNNDGPWTTLGVVRHAESAASQDSTNESVAPMGQGEVPGLVNEYPVWLDIEGEEHDDPATSAL